MLFKYPSHGLGSWIQFCPQPRTSGHADQGIQKIPEKPFLLKLGPCLLSPQGVLGNVTIYFGNSLARFLLMLHFVHIFAHTMLFFNKDLSL